MFRWCEASFLFSAFIIVVAAIGLICGIANASDDLRTIAMRGEAAPGISPTHDFLSFSSPSLDKSGRVLFRGSFFDIDQGTLRYGLWTQPPGEELRLIAVEGNPAPALGEGVVFDSIGLMPATDANGKTAFSARLAGPGVTGANLFSAWRESDNGIVQLIVRDGDPAPGTPSGGVFDNQLQGNPFGIPVMNSNGQIALHSSYSAPSLSSRDLFTGVWVERLSGGLDLVVRGGEPAPSTEPDVEFVDGSFSHPLLNDAGEVAFSAAVTGPSVDGNNNRGIWIGDGGSLRKVARAGDPAPGLSTGVLIGGRPLLQSLNNRGEAAFSAPLARVSEPEAFALWSEGGAVEPRVLVSTGMPAPSTGGAFFARPFGASLNDAGDTAFTAELFGSSVEDFNNRGVWVTDSAGQTRLVAREGGPELGAAVAGFGEFAFFSTPAINEAGRVAFMGRFSENDGVVSTTDPSAIWAEDPRGQLRLIAATGTVLDVSDDPLAPMLKTVLSVSLPTPLGTGSGRPTSFNDLGELTFRAFFADGSSGIFLTTQVAIPEPHTAILIALALTSVLSVSRQR